MDLLDDETTPRNEPEFSVSEISGAVKKTLEGTFARVRVRGEIGRVVRAASGHLYYDLKDDRNVLSCNTWKGQVAGLGMMPEEGMEVIVTGKISSFGGQSRYNMNVDSMEIAGEGALMMLLEKRKKMLAAEGLFDPERKAPIPYLPEIIGVVTSPTGAVIRDILHRLRDRFPRKVLIWPVAVQGDACAPQVSAAIEGFNAMTPGGALPRPDLIIVARGGGSIEDLWGFNEEIVARAAAASEIPLISAVGHETDTTLIDYVSDLRAPTPTAAAEHAVPVRLELMAGLDSYDSRLTRAMSTMIETRKQRMRDIARALPSQNDLLSGPGQRLDTINIRFDAALRSALQIKRGALERASAALRPATLRTKTAGMKQQIDAMASRLDRSLITRVERSDIQLKNALTRLQPARLIRDIAQRRTQLDGSLKSLSNVAVRQLEKWREKTDRLDRLRETLGYQATLDRGYAVVWAGEQVVTTKKAAAAASALEIQFKDGRHAMSGAKPKASKSKPKAQKGLFDE
jgi:exodeoxyribonuclease VII large subunit